MELYCVFVRNPTSKGQRAISDDPHNDETVPVPRHDVEAVMVAIGRRTNFASLNELEGDLRLDLQGVDLGGISVRSVNWSGLDLRGSNL